RRRDGPDEGRRTPLSATAPSTQPPLTEPAILPPAVSAIADPAGRGAEPHVWITVATATRSPASRQRSTWSRMSLIGPILLIPYAGSSQRGPCQPPEPLVSARSGRL